MNLSVCFSLFILFPLLAGCAAGPADSPALPFSLPALFTGPVPGQSDPLVVELRDGNIYQLSAGDDQGTSSVLGRYRIDPEQGLVLLGDQGVLKITRDRLELVRLGTVKCAAPPCRLRRIGGRNPFPRPVLIRGMVRGSGKDYRIKECSSGQEFPVSTREGFVFLRQEMETVAHQMGEAVLVELEGKLLGPPDRIVVHRVRRATAQEDCQGKLNDEQQKGLFGVDWVPRSILGQPVPEATSRGRLFIRFAQQGNRVRGFSGCNRFSGTILLRGDLFLFNRINRLSGYCPDGEEIEEQFFRALDRTGAYRLQDRVLELLDRQGNVVMKLAGTNPVSDQAGSVYSRTR